MKASSSRPMPIADGAAGIGRRVLVALVITASACGFPRPAEVNPDGPPGGSSDGSPGPTTYQLVALEPSTANAGDTVVLEGTFGSAVTVNFPGGVSADATLLGAHRATVVVPTMATIGSVSVTTGGMTVGALPFRRASFALGLQSFQSFYDQSGGAQQMATLGTARTGHTVAVIGPYLFVFGGSSGTGFVRSVERARINADGSLGPFTISDASLVTARAGHVSVIVGIFLYVIGGANDTGALDNVERATINADGSLGAFSTVPGVTLATARKDATREVIGDSLYVFGGTGNGVLSSVERATINPDGSLSAFATVSGVALATARTGHTSAIVGDALYVLGGSGTSGVVGSVERAAIAGDGSLGPFAPVGAGLMIGRAGHTSAVIGNSLYVLGGIGANGPLTAVEQATIHDDNSLGPFTTVSTISLVAARSDYTAALVGNFAYVVGGQGGAGSPLVSVERSSIDSGGDFAAFTQDAAAGRCGPGSVSIGSSFYMLASGGLAKAAVSMDGSLGEFQTHTDPALPPLAEYSTAVIGDRVYLIGGQGFGPVSSFVAVAPINSDDTIGSFTVMTNVSLATPRLNPLLAIVGNSVYAFGGSVGLGVAPDDLERAVIGADGTLGSFVTIGSVGTSTLDATATVIGNFLYIIGGELVFPEGSGINQVFNTVLQAQIGSDGALGAFTTLSNVHLLTGRYAHTAVVVGKYLYIIGGLTSFSATTNFDPVKTVERAAIAPDGSLGPFEQFSGSLNTARSGAMSVVLGNNLNVLCGSSDGGSEHAALQ